MDWTQILFLFFGNAALITWFRSESRADWRHMDTKLDMMHREIHEEMKDFHDRLISLEERWRREK